MAEAKDRGLSHEEYHSRVEYVVAHGISSTVEGKKVIIGSAHFVFEDEGCVIPEGEEAKFNALPARVFAPLSVHFRCACSRHLYLRPAA